MFYSHHIKQLLLLLILCLGVSSVNATEITVGAQGIDRVKYQQLQVKIYKVKEKLAQLETIKDQIKAQKLCQNKTMFYIPSSPKADADGCIYVAVKDQGSTTSGEIDLSSIPLNCFADTCTIGNTFINGILNGDDETPLIIKMRLTDNYGNVRDEEFLTNRIKSGQYSEDTQYDGDFLFYLRSQGKKLTGVIQCYYPGCQLNVEELKIHRKPIVDLEF